MKKKELYDDEEVIQKQKCFVCQEDKIGCVDSVLSSETTKRFMCPECKEIYDSYSWVGG